MMLSNSRKIALFFVGLILLSPSVWASSRLPVLYKAPDDGPIKEVSILFGNRPNLHQRNEEWAILENSDDKNKGYIPLYFHYYLRYANDEVYLLVDGWEPKKITFTDGLYKLMESELSLVELYDQPLVRRNKLFSLDKTSAEKRKHIVKKPNLNIEWKREKIPFCGEIKFILRTNNSGSWDTNQIVFERHGIVSIPYYTVENVICTNNGRIILQLAYYVATGGIRSGDDEWDYYQSIAIIDTGITGISGVESAQ